MFRFKFFLTLVGCLSITLSYAGWTTSTPTPISTTYSYTYQSVYTSCNSATGVFLATWVNGNNSQYPTYSFYTQGDGWSPINTISTTSEANLATNVYSTCDPTSGKFIATWTDVNTTQPAVSVYTPGTGWSSANLLTTSIALGNTANSYDSISNRFLVTWANGINNYPTYSFFTPDGGWGPAVIFSATSQAANVYTAFDSINNSFLAVWVDIGTGYPMYSFYQSGSWSTATPISMTTSVNNDVYCCFNSVSGRFMVTWADINDNLYPFYSIYTPGSGWSEKDTITMTSGVIDNVTISCDSSSGQFLAAWSDLSSGIPTYSFYTQGSGWSAPAEISSTSRTGSDIFNCFNIKSGEFLSAWADTSDPDRVFNPTYSFFTYTPPPPSSLNGQIIRNVFINGVDNIKKLIWTAPMDSSTVVSYRINRNGVVIANVPASDPHVYCDHKQNLKITTLYTIVSVDAYGRQSTPLSIRL